MANKERQKRSARQARARERAELEAIQASAGNSPEKTPAKASAKPVKKDGKPGIFSRARTYLHDVRVEMHRVVWPSKTELSNYSVAVLAMLAIFGVAVWLVDTGFVALLVGFTGLRG